jgi:hypothetical protein
MCEAETFFSNYGSVLQADDMFYGGTYYTYNGVQYHLQCHRDAHCIVEEGGVTYVKVSDSVAG